MSAVLVFGTCVPVGGVQALADDGAAQSAASQGESPLNQRGGQGGSDSNGASSQDSASAGEKDQDVPASKYVSRKDSGTSPPAQGDKPSAAPAAAQAKKTAAANASAAPASLVAVYVDGTNGNDANDGSSFDGKVVKTLSVVYEGATISGSGTSVDGIVLKSGSTLTSAGKLTMTSFKTALTSEKGSTITDGTYVPKDNAGTSGTRSIYLAGTVRGTSRDRLTITADDKSNTNFYASGVTFENCTVNVTSQARTWFDAFDLNLKNASLTVRGFGQTFYVNRLNMDGSDLTINPSTYGGTGMTIQGSSNIVNSHVTTNAGSTAGISVGAKDGTVNVTNSTLEFNNGGTGGLNVNTGTVVLANSTIKGNADNSGALFGAQANGSIVFGENCLVETPAKSNTDNGAGQTGKNFVVTGGPYLVKYASNYNSSYGGTFSKDSVFKKNPDVFAISTDKSGGEVATVKSGPKVSDKKTLDELLESLSDNLRFSFVATFAAPDGVSLPADLDASKVTTHGFGDGFKVSDVKVSGKTVSVTFALSGPDAIKTYSDLEKIVDTAGDGDGWIKLTVLGVLLDKDAEIGAHHTIVGTVDGSFGATAESEAGTHKVFSFTWKGVQLADGKDAVATDDEVIQLTVKPLKSAELNPSNPTPTKPIPSNPTPTKPNTAKPSTGDAEKFFSSRINVHSMCHSLGGQLAMACAPTLRAQRGRDHDGFRWVWKLVRGGEVAVGQVGLRRGGVLAPAVCAHGRCRRGGR